MDENSPSCVDKMAKACMSFMKRCTGFEHIYLCCSDDISTIITQRINYIDDFVDSISTILAMPSRMSGTCRGCGDFFETGMSASSPLLVRQSGA